MLSDANVAAERPIVLAEKRERGGAGLRMADLTRQTFFAGQRLATRSPIGTDETLKAANGKDVKAFYDRWYRPENTVIVVVGDADPMVLAALVEQWFGDWKGTGKPGVAPDFGDPVPPAGAQDDGVTGAPIGQLAVGVEPDLPRSLTYAILRPWRQVTDTIKYNEGLLIDAVAQAIINRRLESRARAGGSFLYAQVQQDDVSRSVDATFVTVTPLTGDWQAALADVRAVIADALANPPTQEEIDREVAEFDVAFANAGRAGNCCSGLRSWPTTSSTRSISARRWPRPRWCLTCSGASKPRLTPDAVLEHTRGLFAGTVTRAVYVTPTAGEADAGALKRHCSPKPRPMAPRGSARSRSRSTNCRRSARPGTIAAQNPLGVLEIEQLDFANGVKALLWANDAEPGRVTVRVRFGAAIAPLPRTTRSMSRWARALVGSGVGELGQDELDRICDRAQDRLRFRDRRGGVHLFRTDPLGRSGRPALSVRRQARDAALGQGSGDPRQGGVESSATTAIPPAPGRAQPRSRISRDRRRRAVCDARSGGARKRHARGLPRGVGAAAQARPDRSAGVRRFRSTAP